MEGVRYKKHEIQLLPGDELFLYTDGITEASKEDHTLFGEDQLLDVLNSFPDGSVEDRCRTVKNAIDAFVGDAEQFDDITMLLLRVNYFRDDDTILTKADHASAEVVWDFISRKTKKAELGARITNKAQIIVDEIYSNIHQYSGAMKAQISCHVDSDKMILTFKDDGIPYNPLMLAEPDTSLSVEERNLGGLGILVVKRLASDISYEYENGCNILTVTIQTDAPQ
jgi:sigma-B regulation protein RsbU (phosphoserine phosphatase)